MKVLDVNPLHEGLHRNLEMLSRLETEMKSIESSVEELVNLEDALKGQGGNAIRSFYSECHVPFLQFYQTFQNQYKTILEQLERALDAFEPNSSGFIRESFLEGEIEQGLNEIAQLTDSLTNEANSIMNQVADIVALPNLDDSDVQEGVRNGKIKRDDTVTQLHEFDTSQTTALSSVETDLSTMTTWVSDIESLFTEGVTDITFPMDKWVTSTARNTIQTSLMHQSQTMVGLTGMTDLDGHPGTMQGADGMDGNSLSQRQSFGDEPGSLYGAGVYSIAGMGTQARPLHDSRVSGASISAGSAIITARKEQVTGQVTSTANVQVEKPAKKKKKNKVLGFLKGAADFLILDDVKTVVDPNASLLAKGFAIFSVTPAGKGLKAANLGFKLVKKSPFGKAIVKKVSVNNKATSKVTIPSSKAETLAKNRAKGKAFEKSQLTEFRKTADNVVDEVTIKTQKGTKIRVDAIGTDKRTGNIAIQEYKSSGTAPLTKNQTKGFPELQSDGGSVVGKGKGIFKGETPIPPTKVEIIRPD